MEKEHFRFYIQVRTSLGETPTAIHQDLITFGGEKAISYSTVLKWHKRFKDEKMDIEDEPRIGRPVSKVTEENIALVRSLIEEDPHSTYEDIQAVLPLSNWTIQTIIHEHLRLRKLTSRWVPHELTPDQKRKRVEFCEENLQRLQQEGFKLGDIITGDETWIYFRKIGRKKENAAWIEKGQKAKTVVRRAQHEEKRLYCIFFRANGWFTVCALDKGETLDSDAYIEKCLRPLVDGLWKERPKTGCHGLKLLHDNARPHNSRAVLNYLREQQIGLMPHPPYSPDLAPCDYWLFDLLKRGLTDQKDDDTLFKSVFSVLNSIPEKEYKKTFSKLVERYKLCIKNKGEYFEHSNE